MCVAVSSSDSIGGSDMDERVPCALKTTKYFYQDYLDTYMDSHVLDSYVNIICVYSLVSMYFQFIEKCKEQDKLLQYLS